MPEQNVKITISAEDRASGPIKNVQGALGNLEKGVSKTGGIFNSLGRAAEVAMGTMATAITTYGIAAVSNLTKEMIKLSVEQSRFQVQTANLLKNTGLQKYAKEVDGVITKHEQMSSFDGEEIQKNFNLLIGKTKDWDRSLRLLTSAEDLAAARGIDLTSATSQILSGFEGSAVGLQKYGVELDEVLLKSMNTAQKSEYLAQQINKVFKGSSEALRSSTAGIFANFQNQLENLKTLFGNELTATIAPTIEGIANKISTLISSGQLQPLVDSFGNLLTKVIGVGSELGGVILKLTGASNESEGITKLADAFDRVAYILSIIEDALSRINLMVKDLQLDKIMNFGVRMSVPGALEYWDYAGTQVQSQRVGAYTPWEASSRGLLATPGPTTLPTEGDSATDAISRLREIQRVENENKDQKKQNTLEIQNNTQNVQFASEILNLMRGNTAKTSGEVDKLGNTAAGAVSYIKSAMSEMRGGGGSGGGCSTFSGYSTTISDGNSSRTISGGGPSGSPGVAWYNEYGNQNASIVAAIGQGNIATVTTASSTGAITGGTTTSGSSFRVGDALITKKGDIVNFHPDDNIMAFKGSGPKGNQQITNNFYIYESSDPDKVAELIMKKIERIGRIGF